VNEQDLQDILLALLTGEQASLGERGTDDGPLLEAVATFEEAGVPTGNKGLVLTTGDGSQFHVMIVRSG
jgi:hypothetical protein